MINKNRTNLNHNIRVIRDLTKIQIIITKKEIKIIMVMIINKTNNIKVKTKEVATHKIRIIKIPKRVVKTMEETQKIINNKILMIALLIMIVTREPVTRIIKNNVTNIGLNISQTTDNIKG